MLFNETTIDLLSRYNLVYNQFSNDRIQILTTFTHADGDPMEMYIIPDVSNSENVLLTDLGMTNMRLSYSMNITDSTNIKIAKLVNSYRFSYNSNTIEISIPLKNLVDYIPVFALVISKVMGLSDTFQTKNINTFYQDFKDLILSFDDLKVQTDYSPIKSRDDVKVDYFIPAFDNTHKNIHLYPVLDNNRAIDVWGRINFFLNNKNDFKSLIVCYDLSGLSKDSQKKLTSESDKVIYSDDFAVAPKNMLQRLVS